MSNPKLHQNLVFASCPLILTFAKVSAAMASECRNQTLAFRLDPFQCSADFGDHLNVILVQPLRDLHLFAKSVLACGSLDGAFRLLQKLVHRHRLEIMTYHVTNSHDFGASAGTGIGGSVLRTYWGSTAPLRWSKKVKLWDHVPAPSDRLVSGPPKKKAAQGRLFNFHIW